MIAHERAATARRRAEPLLACAAAAWLAIATPTTGAAGPPRRGAALPAPPVTSASTQGGLVVLGAPSPSEVLIAAGTFEMGSTPSEIIEAMALCRHESGGSCDLPLERESAMSRREIGLEALLQGEFVMHPVTLPSFWIDRREVTVGDYLRCVDVGPCARPPFAQGAARFAAPTLPVTLVTHDDARTFCAWRGARLPSEAEWERAARGAKGRRFPWGNTYDRRASNHGALGVTIKRTLVDTLRLGRLVVDPRDGASELAPPGSFAAGRTPDGIDDLAGNAAEWVADSFEPRYAAVSAASPKITSTSPLRSVRGGSYLHAAPWLRGAARSMAMGDERATWLGFRCARDAPP